GRRVGKQSAQQIAEELAKLPEGTKLTLLAPLIEQRKGEHKEVLQDARKRGFARARVDGTIRDLDEDIDLDKKRKHDISVVVDRLIVKPGDTGRRLIDSVETALKEGKGILHALTQLPKGGETQSIYSEHLSCPVDGISFPELAPHSFSFNNPLGMCQECNGLGTRPEMDPDLIVPDASRSIREGAIEPWASGMHRGEGWTADFVDQLSRAFKIDLDVPYEKLSKREQDVIMHGSNGREFTLRWGNGGTWRMEWEGLLNKLMRSFKTTQSESMRRYYMKFFSNKPCPTCQGERLKRESRAVRVHGKTLVELSQLTIGEASAFLEGLPLTAT